jgi:hypothetical protein
MLETLDVSGISLQYEQQSTLLELLASLPHLTMVSIWAHDLDVSADFFVELIGALPRATRVRILADGKLTNDSVRRTRSETLELVHRRFANLPFYFKVDDGREGDRPRPWPFRWFMVPGESYTHLSVWENEYEGLAGAVSA